MTERVSVVVLCYNTGAFVGEAIESALAQTLLPSEVIVINDGSTDDSEVEIARFGSRVKVFAQPNRGTSASRNTGIRLSGGTHLAFLDADDVWPRESLEARMRTLMETGVDIAFGRVRQSIGGVGRTSSQHGPLLAARGPGSILSRRQVFDRVGSFDETLRTFECVDWLARAEALGCTSAATDDVVLIRRIHGGNATLTHPFRSRDLMIVLRRDLARKRKVLRA